MIVWILLLIFCAASAQAQTVATIGAGSFPLAQADGSTKGILTLTINDFECTPEGLCSIDYTNAQAASSTTNGFLSAAHWNLFNSKQNVLGFTPEDVSRKKSDAGLGPSNEFYPTQGAVLEYVNNGVKALTNTAITPRPCIAGPGSPIVLNADNLTGCDFVQIAELSGTTTFDISGTFVNGQWLTILIYTATQRAVTFTTGVGKFAAEGITLPTFTRAADYSLYAFRYNALSNRWAFGATNQDTNYGTAGYVRTAGGPGVESSWQPPASGVIAGTIGTIHLPMSAAKPPFTGVAAVYDGSEANGRLRFDGGAIVECAEWGPFRMNSDYASTPVFKLQYSMTSATGAVGVAIGVYVMTEPPSSGVDMNNDALYGAVNTCTQTPVPAVLGDYKEISCALTNNDGMGPGRFTKIKLCRQTGDGVDTATTSDLEGLTSSLEYTR